MEILIGSVFILALVVIALYVGLQKKEIVEEKPMPTIHTSGIYSVMRRSPRENISSAKPSGKALSAWLDTQSLSPDERIMLASNWGEMLEKSLSTVEMGDKIGVQRFSLALSDFCEPCRGFLDRDYCITREDIFKQPGLLPPYYPGCQCRLVPESEWKSALPVRIRLLSDPQMVPQLPDWRQVRKIS